MLKHICLSTNTYALELGKDKCTDYVFSWKSKGVFKNKFQPLYAAFLHSIKISEYRIVMKFDKEPLPLEQNSYLTKILNVYVAYNLETQPRNPSNYFKFKNRLFQATNTVKNSDMCIVDMERHLIVQVHGVLIMTFLELL